MANSPPPGAFDPNQAILDRIKALEMAVKNLTNKTLYSASIGSGGLTVNNGGSITLTSGGVINMPLGGSIRDTLNNIIFSADNLNGQRLSTPFLAVPGYALWDGNDGAAFRTGGSTGDYVIQAQHCTTEKTLWTGTIPQVVHPCVRYYAVLGRVTGSTSTPTYRLRVGGNVVDTFSSTTYAGRGSPLQNITGITSFGVMGTAFSLSVQADVTSTDYFACSLACLVMCGN